MCFGTSDGYISAFGQVTAPPGTFVSSPFAPLKTILGSEVFDNFFSKSGRPGLTNPQPLLMTSEATGLPPLEERKLLPSNGLLGSAFGVITYIPSAIASAALSVARLGAVQIGLLQPTRDLSQGSNFLDQLLEPQDPEPEMIPADEFFRLILSQKTPPASSPSP